MHGVIPLNCPFRILPSSLQKSLFFNRLVKNNVVSGGRVLVLLIVSMFHCRLIATVHYCVDMWAHMQISWSDAQCVSLAKTITSKSDIKLCIMLSCIYLHFFSAPEHIYDSHIPCKIENFNMKVVAFKRSIAINCIQMKRLCLYNVSPFVFINTYTNTYTYSYIYTYIQHIHLRRALKVIKVYRKL